MTTVTVTTTVPQRGKTEDDSAVYESPSAHIIEETEYVRKIRTTLEKIRNQIFRDEVRHNSTNHKLDAKRCGNIQNGSDSAMDPSCDGLDLLRERIKGKDLQLLEMNKENEVLKIKLEASREAGAAALRNVAQRLFENYQTQSEDVRKKHEDSRHLLQVDKLEKEQKLKQHVENLDQIAEKLEEKRNQITELENLVQRMEKEKRTLLEKKLSLENKLLHLKSNATNTKSCQDLQKEISLLQEQISHLQFVIHSQHQNLRSVIQEMEALKNNLKEQDKRIEDLQEKVNILEAQNKELKTKVALWPETPRTKVSKAVSTSELKTEATTPYLMLVRLRNKLAGEPNEEEYYSGLICSSKQSKHILKRLSASINGIHCIVFNAYINSFAGRCFRKSNKGIYIQGKELFLQNLQMKKLDAFPQWKMSFAYT